MAKDTETSGGYQSEDDSVRQEGGSLWCRLLGHAYIEVKDTTQCEPGFYRPFRSCRKCGREEYMIDDCVRDDAEWAAIQVEKLLRESGNGE